MPASYPGTIKVFTTKRNALDVVYAADPNTIQDEVVAIQQTLGLNPHVSTASGGSSLGSWSSASRVYASLSDRLANAEAGHLADTHSQYLKLALLDAKGDLLVGSADNTAGRLPLGANGQVLVADSAEALGVKWSALGVKTLRLPHTFSVPGDILAASGSDNIIPGFFIPAPVGQTSKIVAVRHKVGVGSFTWSLNRAGSSMSGVASIQTTTTPTTTAVTSNTGVAADGDEVQIVIATSPVSTAKNLSFTIFVDYSVA